MLPFVGAGKVDGARDGRLLAAMIEVLPCRRQGSAAIVHSFRSNEPFPLSLYIYIHTAASLPEGNHRYVENAESFHYSVRAQKKKEKKKNLSISDPAGEYIAISKIDSSLGRIKNARLACGRLIHSKTALFERAKALGSGFWNIYEIGIYI